MRTNVEDGVTGAVAEIEMVVDLPIDRVWALITDVGRIGEWSPETSWGAWRPGQGDVPATGARFDARNGYGYGDGFGADVECVVTEATRPSVFEWVVLDDDADVARPGSVWRYELEPAGEGRSTLVRHRFTHGPGNTGLREAVREHPERSTVDGRLARLRRNMTATLRAMVDSERLGR